jgi:hypothetical protein
MAAPAKYEVFIDGAKDPSPTGRERLAQALSSHYGLPLEQAKRVVAGGHFRVKRDVDLTMARRYVSHLEGLGARASVVESGPRAAPTGAPDARPVAARAPAAAPPARAPAASPDPARAPAASDLVPGPDEAAVPTAAPDEFGISISGLMLDAGAPPAAAPTAPPPPAAAPAPAAPPRAAAPAPPPHAAAAPAPAPAAPAPRAAAPAPPPPAAATPAPPPRAAAAPAPAAPPTSRPLGAGSTPPGPGAGAFSVVTLDGEGDGGLELERGEAPASASAFAPPGDASDEFLPPDERAGGLELALDLPSKPSKAPRPPAAPIADLNAPIEEVPLSDEKLNASRAAQSFGLEEAPPPPGATLELVPAPRPAAPPPPVAPPTGAVPRPSLAPAPWPQVAREASRARVPVGGLFGGRIRQSLAARVLLGVLLCVSVSFVPASLYASRAHSTTIRALQLEERELGERPPATAQERTPAVVRQEIAGARTRAFVVTLFIWVTCAAVLGFLWFRFV